MYNTIGRVLAALGVLLLALLPSGVAWASEPLEDSGSVHRPALWLGYVVGDYEPGASLIHATINACTVAGLEAVGWDDNIARVAWSTAYPRAGDCVIMLDAPLAVGMVSGAELYGLGGHWWFTDGVKGG